MQQCRSSATKRFHENSQNNLCFSRKVVIETKKQGLKDKQKLEIVGGKKAILSSSAFKATSYDTSYMRSSWAAANFDSPQNMQILVTGGIPHYYKNIFEKLTMN